ncbi:putative mfs multidrug transporter protein [Botrytis fragariae]|uniref:Putative mfs multidrug transporter protein n=1 Tax=Botrytis fragariae TaxID=1964551 RepID=A0A8H6B0L8_9HELO|nr:putative mfs multidrug transporter protein [Botrytis fragariae]KAF5877211.1 putative mfs multidrug transporter protein [Botrytis fragariae]
MSIVIEELGRTENDIQLPVFPTEPEPIPSPIPTPTIVTWDGPSDPHDPFNWSPRKKWLVITLALLASFISSMNGTILSVAHNPINTEFHISDSHFPNSYWPIASWGVGGAIFSLVLFPVMEDFGIRPVFLGTYLLFVASLIPIGFARNFETLVVVRFFSGGCVQLLSNAVAGVISNVWRDDRERSVPISLYVTTYLVSTSMGPVIGAAILQYLDWRWIGHIELIWTVAFFPLFIFCLPESRGSAILLAKAKQQRQEGTEIYTAEELHKQPIHKILIKSVQRPLYMLLTESVVFIATLWAAFSLGTIYLFTQSVEQVYSQLYNWNSLQAGYVQLAIAIGECVGCLLCMYTNSWYYDSASRNTEVPGTPIPEARLYPSVIGGFLGVTGGMFLYGWTSLSSLHWLIPTIGLFLVGFGTSAIIISNANYLVDAYSKYAASALGAVGLVENIALAFIPLASERMYTDLRFQWASSLLGFVSLGLVATPFAVFRWGKVIRGRSPFMKEAVLEKRGLMVGDEGAGVGVREV